MINNFEELHNHDLILIEEVHLHVVVGVVLGALWDHSHDLEMRDEPAIVVLEVDVYTMKVLNEDGVLSDRDDLEMAVVLLVILLTPFLPLEVVAVGHLHGHLRLLVDAVRVEEVEASIMALFQNGLSLICCGQHCRGDELPTLSLLVSCDVALGLGDLRLLLRRLLLGFFHLLSHQSTLPHLWWRGRVCKDLVNSSCCWLTQVFIFLPLLICIQVVLNRRLATPCGPLRGLQRQIESDLAPRLPL